MPGVWQRQDLGTDACGVDLGGSLEGAKWLGRARALSNRERRAERGPGRRGEGRAARPVHSGVPSVPQLAACPPAQGKALCPAPAPDASSHRRLPPLSGAGEGRGCLATPPADQGLDSAFLLPPASAEVVAIPAGRAEVSQQTQTETLPDPKSAVPIPPTGSSQHLRPASKSQGPQQQGHTPRSRTTVTPAPSWEPLGATPPEGAAQTRPG